MQSRMSLAALCAVLAAPAAAQDLPARKAGLWEIRMTVESPKAPPQVSQQCVDAATDRQMQAMGTGMQKDMCSKQDVRRSGNTITIDSVCKFGPTTSVSQAVVTGDFNSAYTMRVTSKSSGGPAAGNSTIVIEAKWLGACKAGQRPGDMVLPGGHKINITDMQKAFGGAPK